MKKLLTLSAVLCLLARAGSAQTCPTVSHNPYTDFNSSSNTGTATTLWVNVHLKLTSGGNSGLMNNNDYIMFKGGTITLSKITSTPQVSAVAMPSGIIIASSSVNAPVTSYNAASNTWVTEVPPGYSSADIFIAGAAISSSSGYVASGGKKSTVSAEWQSNLGNAFSSAWFYCLACYQPTFICNDVANNVSSVANGIHAGTPINEEGSLVAGGSSGGGSDFTGSNSSTDNFTACQPSPLSASGSTTVTFTGGVVNSGAALSVLGGTGIYTFLWSNGATTQNLSNVPPGVYTVTITDIDGETKTVTVTVGTILPIQLVSFDADKEASGVMFKWQTAIELDNKYFVVERSYDCITFDSLLSISGNGTSNIPHDYTAFDEQIPRKTTYYRLRQVNDDGSSSYSSIKVIQAGNTNSTYRVYPNPAADYIMVENDSQKSGAQQLDMYDVNGTRVFGAKLSDSPETKIFLPFLPDGCYTVIVTEESGSSQSFKILVTR